MIRIFHLGANGKAFSRSGHAYEPCRLSGGAETQMPQPLSQRLRSATAPLHRQAEAALNFPACVHDRASYVATLVGFYGLYAPLEQALSLQRGWECLGLNLRERVHSSRLVRDLAILGSWPPPSIMASTVGWLTSFPQALGALYVLEGSTLGGQVILRHLEARSAEIPTDATCFFSGHGAQTGAMWKSMVEALDCFGDRHPEAGHSVQEGTTLTYQAIIRRFTSPLHQSETS
ncbi:biliverdin-producing heme oxygenase [Thiocapsa sp. UBA6158]|uniref:biliverdin-producing heme oxygenase n=1 Tax=Thiocapsa sp. UBA6158 TaxID=1947692 RepID=UPI0025F420A9|nr:biliverdin-producing heme oxygenase [Thiocapsa sp. UBA6158]